jgi:signal transduction histidine kinase
MLEKKSTELRSEKLPWWTWIVPLPVCFLGTLLSLEARITIGTSLFYFPLPFALTMIYWWGPRILPAFYLNAVCCAGLWGLTRVGLWPLYGLPETVFVFLSWLLFRKTFSGTVSLANTKQLRYFLVFGILIPLVVYKLMLEGIFVLAGDASPQHYWNLVFTTGFGDFISTFCVSLPLLYFLTTFMIKVNLVIDKSIIGPADEPLSFTRTQAFEMVTLAVMAWCVNTFLGFSDYWFLNGILSLYVAVRFGFGATLLMNSFILIISYLIPAAIRTGFSPQFIETAMLKTQLGTTLLYVFSTITARLVSDMRLSEQRLNDRNKELNQMNSEMDRFVYSVSHDLSAPLKSIQGLVNVSRMSVKEHEQLFTLIEKSANKLELFIEEVLDYSRNKRSEVLKEAVNIKVLSREVFNDLLYMDGFHEIEFNNDNLIPEVVICDRSRLKIIFQNLLSNAIKFRRTDQQSFVKLSAKLQDDRIILSMEDNGEGIKPEYQPKIFDMFFRGTNRSEGSGLGLYIAREAAKKINARISVRSVYGEGSVFNIELEVDVEKLVG